MRRVALALLLTSCTHGGVHIENDIFDPFQHNNDRYYTHGTRFTYKDTPGTTYSIGQNIYTPSNKKATAGAVELSKDRPYGGWLYGEYRRTTVQSPTLDTTYGIQVGCLGPCSFAKESQQGIHKLLGQNIPAWIPSDTLKSEPGFILEYEKRKLIYGNGFSDLVGYGLGKFGNIIDSASVGATWRSGYNIGSPFQGVAPIVFKASPDEFRNPWRAYAFTTIEERGVAYNHLLQGSFIQSEAHTVKTEPFVTEIDAGVSLGYGNFLFTYMWSHFSTEWKHGTPFAFGGLNFDW